MAMQGMNIEQVRQFATQAQHGSEQIKQVGTQLTSRLNSVEWVGPDVNKFKGDWHTYQAQLNKIAEALVQIAQSANKEAQQQEQASAS